MISIDTTNYYDRVAYLFTSLTAQYFGVALNYILVLLQAIQSMNMYLQILFRVLTSAYCRTDLLSFQGAVQGNRVAPILCLIISIILIHFLHLKGLVAKHITLILRILF